MNNIDNFSAFHNFRFEVSGVKMRKAFKFTVGTGKLIPYDELYIIHQKACRFVNRRRRGVFASRRTMQGHLNQAKNILKIKMKAKGMPALYAQSRTVSSRFIA